MGFGNFFSRSDDGQDKHIVVNAASSEPIVEQRHQDHDHDHEGDFVTANERNDLARGLHQRHIGLIALAGAIVSPVNALRDINGADH